jgi:hypothetical protein
VFRGDSSGVEWVRGGGCWGDVVDG